MEIVTALQQLGFAEYEARAYVALVGRSPLNGYELAKASGIPRANIYGVLERLWARRAVVKLDEPGGTRYAPVPPAELMRRIGGEYEQIVGQAGRSLEALEPAAVSGGVWNVEGYPALLDQARAAIRAARESLLVALCPQEAAELRSELADAERRDIEITTLCTAACERECGGCRGDIYRLRTDTADSPRRLVVVTDDAEVVAGQIEASGVAHTVRTQQRLLVDVCRSSVRSGIALAAVVAELGARLDAALSARTRGLIEAAAPAGDAAGFVDRLRELRLS